MVADIQRLEGRWGIHESQPAPGWGGGRETEGGQRNGQRDIPQQALKSPEGLRGRHPAVPRHPRAARMGPARQSVSYAVAIAR